ncbi:Enoyl-CoA hydratase domain-containing protein 1 [Fukomys damarensis]|uniref:Ethylmalonyl-CoA decarboxylase n=3 Tax=Fukomys damarensis TaxID=885580 RepID=A0A091DQP0_FUKDA|nr:Enoyl-CoA hydratase domain-containing protein 1 [Fukomys damarensis]
MTHDAAKGQPVISQKHYSASSSALLTRTGMGCFCSFPIQDTEAAIAVKQPKTPRKGNLQNCFRKWQERWDLWARSSCLSVLSSARHRQYSLLAQYEENQGLFTGTAAYFFPEMANRLLKTSSVSARTKLLHQVGTSLYNTTHGFEEEEVKKTLQQFPGGSVDLRKDDGGIGILTLNNPSKMNAFSGTMMLQLLEKVIELENWTEGKGLIVRGAKNTFSSGSDLNAVKALATPEDGMALCMFMQNTLTRLTRLPLISVALVQGRALGGGAEFTTACDFRLMTPESEIRFVHKEMGIIPSWGGASRLVEIIGSREALKVLGGALRLDPKKALSIGMVEEILQSSDETKSLEEAQAWLTQFVNGPPEVIRALKKSVCSGKELYLEEALQNERDLLGTVWGGAANLQAIARRGKFNK